VRAEIVTESHTPAAMVMLDRGLILIHRCGRPQCCRCRLTACPRKLASIVVAASVDHETALDPAETLAEITRALFAPLVARLEPDQAMTVAMNLAATHWH